MGVVLEDNPEALGHTYGLAAGWQGRVYRLLEDGTVVDWLVDQMAFRTQCQKFLYRERARQTWE